MSAIPAVEHAVPLAAPHHRRRVLMVAFHYPPAHAPGALRTLKFTKWLGEHGWTPSVLTAPPARAGSRDDALLEQVPATLHVHRAGCFDAKATFAIHGKYPGFLEIPDRYLSWLPPAVWKGVRIVRAERITALFSTSPIPTAHLIAGIIHRITGVPWVAELRDPWSAAPNPGRARQAIARQLERTVVRRAGGIVTTTALLASQLATLHGAVVRRKINVIPNGYDEDDFADLGACPPTEPSFRLIHAGHLYDNARRPTALLQALRACLDAETLPSGTTLDFIGDGERNASSVVAREVEHLRLTGTVRFGARIGYRAALAAMMSSSALVLLQGGSATFTQVPAKAFEYLRSGRPVLVLAPAGSSTDEVVRRFPAVWRADMDDVAAIAAALVLIYDQWASGLRVVDRRGPQLARYERRQTTRELAQVLDAVVAAQEGIVS